MKQFHRHLTIISFVAILIVIKTPVYCQLSQGGVPRSFTFSMVPDNREVVTLAAPAPEPLFQEDQLHPVPYRFAVNIPVDLDFSKSGSMATAMDGSRVWRMTLAAPGALALTLYFDRFHLPAGGKLFVYNPGRTQLLGAFTALNNNLQHTFATSLILGDRLTLEYDTPDNAGTPDFHINEVAYAYRGVNNPKLKTGFGSAGACEVNVNCSEGDAWAFQQRGVARLQVKNGGGTVWCSGSVINTTRNDGSPYLLTADHCTTGATASDISKWIFYFNYEGTGCPNPSAEPDHITLTGATLKARAGQDGSDFFLVLLNQRIPASYNVYYNGWNRGNVPSPSGVGIHHPQGDIKKISTYTHALQTTTWNGNNHQSHWLVTWSGSAHGHGVTEGGSSGSPIFDNNGLLVGTLTGGDSMCDSAYLNSPDYYGKFSYDWDQNGADSASVLKYWLDPDNTGVLTLAGRSVGMEELQDGTGFGLFPNPVRDILHIRRNTSSRPFLIRITDTRGLLLQEREYSLTPAADYFLDLSFLAPGLYFVSLVEQNRQTVRKIIKL